MSSKVFSIADDKERYLACFYSLNSLFKRDFGFFFLALFPLQETADMLKSHIKEELMQGEEDESVYESMAHLSTDLLMKCSLNPGSDEELYESMAGFVPGAPEDLCMYIHRVTESWEGLG